MEALIALRGRHKSAITRIEKWYSANKDHNDITQFVLRSECLIKAFQEYNLVQDKIEIEDEEQESDRESTENRYFEILGAIKNTITSLQQATVAQTSSINQTQISFVKLPDLQIPQFTGDIVQWKNFIQLFDRAVIQNTNLSGAEKLTYLKSYLKNEPLNLINTLEIEDSNFQIALDTLKDRYDDQLAIIYAHIKNLLESPSLSKSFTLRQFITYIKQNIESLKNLNAYSLELFLVYIFAQKLDSGTKKAFEFGCDTQNHPKLDDFVKFLEDRCKILERKIPESTTDHKKSQPPRISHNVHFSQNLQSNLSNTINCGYCNLPGHRISRCSSYLNLPYSDKQEYIKRNYLCSNCLGNNHRFSDCRSPGCTICQNKHHSSLHINRVNNTFNGNRTLHPSNPPPRNFPHHTPQNFAHSSTTQFRPRCQVNTQNNFQNSNRYLRNNNQGQSHTINSNNSTTNSTSTQIPSTSNIQPTPTQNQPSTQEVVNQHTHTHTEQVLSTLLASGKSLLATAQVILYTVEQIPIKVKAVFDTCSTTSLMTEGLVERLKLKTKHAQVSINGVDGIATTSNKILNNVDIYSNINNNYKFTINCTVVKQITTKLPQFNLQINKIPIPQHIILADPEFHTPCSIDILLGADIYYSLLKGGIIRIQKNFLTLLDTHLGYIVGGAVPTQVISRNICETNTEQTEDTCLFLQNSDDNFLQKFWSIEEPPSNLKTILTPENELSEQIFTDTTKILDNGSFQVNLPLKSIDEHSKLGNSFHIAKKRFFNLERRFENNTELFSQYKNFVDEYITLNHGRYIPLNLKNDNNENKYFLPHHCVIKPDSTTTKLRVVFDASAKSSSGYSLNDIMLKGYTVQPELFDILCRFRCYKFVLILDIEKMYRQIRINPEQTYLQNILWRDNPNENLKCIELLTVTYGTNSAPYLATRTLNELAYRKQHDFPLAAEAVLQQCYVDDILCGSNSLTELNELYIQLNRLFASANFNLHKWCSNSTDFLNTIFQNTEQKNYDIKIENVSNKVLGISWNQKSDIFSVSLPQNTNINLNTKRDVLSKIAQMFDPLGFIGPVIVVAKIIMQKVWIDKLGWDDTLQNNLLKEWIHFFDNIHKLSSLSIPRYLFCDKVIKFVELHGFADASLKAYGACLYIRAVYTDNTVSSKLAVSKSRVAPIKTVTLPRLELCAAVLLSNLISKVKSTFEGKFVFNSINLWSDSQITLSWLKSHPSRWTIFVSNRVAEIQNLTADCKWRYVKSAKNPADCLSRGLTPDEILHSTLWWHGPQFLTNPHLNLKSYDSDINIDNLPEQRKTETVLINVTDNFWQTLFEKFSSFVRLQRTVAYIFRFINNLKPNSDKINKEALTVQELQNSSNFIIKMLQINYFSKEIKEITANKTISNRAILQLSPFIDDLGLLRVGGRLSYSDLPFNQKHPLLLPSKNHVTSLLLKKEHLILGHAGPQNVLSNFKLKFWPLNGLREIKKIIQNCLTCYRFKAQTCQQIMSNIPEDRVKPARPFSKVGVDFGGPFLVKTSKLRRAPLIKSYIAIFVCMVTKAVHIELVSDLSTDNFILTLKRFIARRGAPSIIFSDNATNFLGSKNQLKDVYDFFKKKDNINKLETFLTQKETVWKFIPPRSPHWGGLWEAAIKSTKYHLYRIIGESHVNFEELTTILAQIEAILNSRPLLPMSTDPCDLTYLTPGHFLIGDSLTSLPELDMTDIPENRLSRWNKCTQIQQLFWKKWSRDYLNRLQNKPKWLKPQSNLKLNDLVLLKEDNTSPLKWPRARVIELMPGKDQKIRVVKVRTADGTLIRPITKICPLPEY